MSTLYLSSLLGVYIHPFPLYSATSSESRLAYIRSLLPPVQLSTLYSHNHPPPNYQCIPPTLLILFPSILISYPSILILYPSILIYFSVYLINIGNTLNTLLYFYQLTIRLLLGHHCTICLNTLQIQLSILNILLIKDIQINNQLINSILFRKSF